MATKKTIVENMMMPGVDPITASKIAEEKAREADMFRNYRAARVGKALSKVKTVSIKKGGKVSSASSRADGCCSKGKTKGTMVAMRSGGKTKSKMC